MRDFALRTQLPVHVLLQDTNAEQDRKNGRPASSVVGLSLASLPCSIAIHYCALLSFWLSILAVPSAKRKRGRVATVATRFLHGEPLVDLEDLRVYYVYSLSSSSSYVALEPSC